MQTKINDFLCGRFPIRKRFFLCLFLLLAVNFGFAQNRPLPGNPEFFTLTRDTNKLYDTLVRLVEIRLNNPDSSMQEARKHLITCQNLGFRRGEVNCYKIIGDIHDNKLQADSAIFYYNKCLTVCQSAGFRNGEAIMYRSLATVERIAGRYATSYKHYAAGLNVAEEIGDVEHQTACLNGMAILQKNLGNKEGSLDQYRKLRTSTRKNGMKEKEATVSINMGMGFMAVHELDSAEACFLEGLRISMERNYAYLVRQAYVGLARVNLDRKEYGEANNFINLALGIPVRGDSDYYQLGMRSLQAKIWEMQGRYRDALELNLKVLEGARKYDLPEIKKSSLGQISKCYEGLGDYKNALPYLRMHLMLGDSLKNLQISRQAMEIQDQYENDKRDRAVMQMKIKVQEDSLARAKQEFELERQEIKLERQNRQRNYFLLGLVATLGILGMVGYAYWNRRKLTQELAEKNVALSSALEEKEILLGEVHHRVKNNLQLIYNLLDLQLRGLEDESAKSALEDSRNRVASMATVHRRLYRGEHPGGVAMPNYIRELLEAIRQSFRFSPEKLRFQLEIAPLLLDLDSSITLGLIINELVTNTCKYAFPEGKKGTLFLSLAQENEALVLTVKDDGVGLHAGDLDPGKDSFGLRILRSLVRQLKGTFETQTGDGATFVVRIKKYKLLRQL